MQQNALDQNRELERLRHPSTQEGTDKANVGPLKQELKPSKKRGRPSTKFIRVEPRLTEPEEKEGPKQQDPVNEPIIDEVTEPRISTQNCSHEVGVVKYFTIKEGKNEVKIILKRLTNRMVKLEFLINDIPMKPTTFTGMSAAMNFWNLLQTTIK